MFEKLSVNYVGSLVTILIAANSAMLSHLLLIMDFILPINFFCHHIICTPKCHLLTFHLILLVFFDNMITFCYIWLFRAWVNIFNCLLKHFIFWRKTTPLNASGRASFKNFGNTLHQKSSEKIVPKKKSIEIPIPKKENCWNLDFQKSKPLIRLFLKIKTIKFL